MTFQFANGSANGRHNWNTINRKWKKSCNNCEAYSSFSSVSSDHHIVSCKVKLKVLEPITRNKQYSTFPMEYISLCSYQEIQERFSTGWKNRYQILQNEMSNTIFNNFIKAHQETAKGYIPRIKIPRIKTLNLEKEIEYHGSQQPLINAQRKKVKNSSEEKFT